MTTVACNEEICVNLCNLWDLKRINSSFEWRQGQSDTVMGKIKHQYNTMNKEDRNSFRKEMLGKLEEQWAKSNSVT